MNERRQSRITKALKYLARYVAPLVPIGLLVLTAISDIRKGSAKQSEILAELSAIRSEITALKTELGSHNRRIESLEIKVFLVDRDLASAEASIPVLRRDLAMIVKPDTLPTARVPLKHNP